MSDATPPPAISSDGSISILDLIQVLAKRKWLIAGITVAGGLAIVAYAALSMRLPADSEWNLLPNVYRPEVEVLLLDRVSGSGLGATLGGGSSIGGLASLLGVSQMTNSSAGLAQALLQGRTLQDQLVREFDFVARYGLSGPEAGERARNRMIVGLSYEYDASTNILTIAYEDIDAEFATEFLGRALEILTARFRSLTMETVLRKKAFLEERIVEVNEERRGAQDALVAFQRRYGIVDLVVQTEQTILLIAQYRHERLTQELELQRLLEYRSADDAGVIQIRNRIELFDQLIDQLETGGQRFGGGAIPQAQLPELAVESLNLSNELELQEGIYALLRQQYETTRIEETDTSQTFQILERAAVPALRHRPSRTRIAIVFTIAAFMLSVLLAFVLEALERARRDPDQAEKLASIRLQLVPWRRPPKQQP